MLVCLREILLSYKAKIVKAMYLEFRHICFAETLFYYLGIASFIVAFRGLLVDSLATGEMVIGDSDFFQAQTAF
jgi:hypothetical protein